ncbi:MAG: HEAT repeat domain-containing protein [Planctomycetes bacterium]|nr:HEAT repeat domain-containing protein [Planctomycetota bacterium]
MSEIKVESGILVAGPMTPDATAILSEALAYDPVVLSEHVVCVRTEDPRKGYDLTAVLFQLSSLCPECAVVGFFCDSVAGAEGARLFQGGREVERREMVWAEAEGSDSLSWPIGSLAMTLGIQANELTRVVRPERPPLAQSLEGLFRNEEPTDPELLRQAIELLGQLPMPEVTEVLVRYLTHPDWITRYHAARAYSRIDRGAGLEGLPRLESILEDEDEGVREAALQGLAELIPETSFSNVELISQIDAALEIGLKDEDEDVRTAAEEAAELRKRLIG